MKKRKCLVATGEKKTSYSTIGEDELTRRSKQLMQSWAAKADSLKIDRVVHKVIDSF